MEEKPEEKGTDLNTVATYDAAAESYAQKYEALGTRLDDVERGFELCKSSDEPFVVELGPGNGREAEIIVKKAAKYIGIDVSKAMVQLAQVKVPEGEFIISDATKYEFPSGIDIVFAFASLLHLDKEQLKGVLDSASKALNLGGVFYLSLKRKAEYSKKIETDEFGDRLFYYYDKETLELIAPADFETVYSDEQHYGADDWITLVYRKI